MERLVVRAPLFQRLTCASMVPLGLALAVLPALRWGGPGDLLFAAGGLGVAVLFGRQAASRLVADPSGIRCCKVRSGFLPRDSIRSVTVGTTSTPFAAPGAFCLRVRRFHERDETLGAVMYFPTAAGRRRAWELAARVGALLDVPVVKSPESLWVLTDGFRSRGR